jgi:hypothetical protein
MKDGVEPIDLWLSQAAYFNGIDEMDLYRKSDEVNNSRFTIFPGPH